MSSILTLPPEVIELALILLDPADVSHVAQTCRYLHELVYKDGDAHIWRKLYLGLFDDPRMENMYGYKGIESYEEGAEWKRVVDWKQEVQRQIKTRNFVRSFPAVLVHDLVQPVDPTEFEFALASLISLVENTPSRRSKLLPLKNAEWISTLLKPKLPTFLILQHPLGSFFPNIESLRSKLFVYLAPSPTCPETRSRVLSRAFVYNARNYSSNSRWGPFEPNGSGRVNWTHIKHIYTVISTNIDEYNSHLSWYRPPEGWEAIRGWSTKMTGVKSEDWAGVEGDWGRILCFMDYHDYHEYNFGNAHSTHPSLLPGQYSESYEEALRPLKLKLKVTRYDHDHHTAKPGRPVIYFEGTSDRGSPNEAYLRGSVSMTVDGEIQWHFIVDYGEHDMWLSNGVQIGGVCSAKGVLGSWTSVHHDSHDPIGPFWMWKTKFVA